MVKKKKSKEKCCNNDWKPQSGCFVYLLAFIGTSIYYISISTGFWSGVLGVLKALIWPLFLTLEVLKFIGA